MSVSVIVPAYNEGEAIVGYLDRLFAAAPAVNEVLVVYDFVEDTTAAPLARYAQGEPRLHPRLNTYGRGPANAIRFGFDAAAQPVSVVTMADGSDDAGQIADLARLVESGAVIAAASRYMRGGRQLGGPRLKGMLSKMAGLSLYHLGRVGTRDATNSFKAYRTDFVRAARIESSSGFEIGIELVAKARRARLPVVEIPTTWRDREVGESRFRLMQWIPKYLRWYFHAFGRRHPIEGFAP
jgi:glycosyltransferase involved in cell wall biosynthesis